MDRGANLAIWRYPPITPRTRSRRAANYPNRPRTHGPGAVTEPRSSSDSCGITGPRTGAARRRLSLTFSQFALRLVINHYKDTMSWRLRDRQTTHRPRPSCPECGKACCSMSRARLLGLGLPSHHTKHDIGAEVVVVV